MKKSLFPLLLVAFLPLYSPAQAPASSRANENLKLIWHDEFDRPGAPDPSRWQFEHGFVRNQELQWYQPQNARVIDGVLQITGRRERVANPNYQADSRNWKRNRRWAEYTSSCIESRERFTSTTDGWRCGHASPSPPERGLPSGPWVTRAAGLPAAKWTSWNTTAFRLPT